MAQLEELIEQYYLENFYKRKCRDYTIFVDNEWILITAEELSGYFENSNLKHISKNKVPGLRY